MNERRLRADFIWLSENTNYSFISLDAMRKGCIERSLDKNHRGLTDPTRYIYPKICASSKDFSKRGGARTFLSAANRNVQICVESFKAVVQTSAAADKNVRAPVLVATLPPED